MSLNCTEIDLVLAELDLTGSRIQKVFQPSYDAIVLELYARGRKSLFLASVASGACRIHGLSSPPAKNERALRFMECLKSRLVGGVIASAVQLPGQRILRLEILAPDADAGESTAPATRRYRLYLRLWSGAGNMILVDERDLIVDALLRKPGKGESTGQPCRLDAEFGRPLGEEEKAALEAKYRPRDLPGEGSFSERVEAFYSASAGQWSRESLLARAEERYSRRRAAILARQAELGRLVAEYSGSERLRQIGDLLMSGGWSVGAKSGTTLVELEDYYLGGRVGVRVDAGLSPVENARRYYEKAKKAASGLSEVEAELGRARAAEAELEAWIAGLRGEKDPFALAKALEKAGTVRETPRRLYPCLHIDDSGWTILVGRSGKENDELLRRHVRGSDLWLHVRDYAGAYVFVKARKGKTFPLEILLDAGGLAIYYSKARKNSGGEVRHTFVKYLKRVKDGPKGLVTPAMEKNLSVRLDEKRIRELLAGSQGETDEQNG